MARQFTLGKKQRLKSRKQIDWLFKNGKSFTLFPYRVYYGYHDSRSVNELITGHKLSKDRLRFGIGAGTRNFKKATDRNRIKRVSREAWRLQKKELQELLEKQKAELDVFLVYNAKELPAFDMIYQKVKQIIIRLSKQINENDPQNP